MGTVKVREQDLPRMLDLGERRIRRAIAAGALAGAHRGRTLMTGRTPVDRGQLKAGWKVKAGAPEFGGMFDETLAELGNDAPHLSFVELGSRPHAVSPEGWQAIYEWVRRHFRGGKLGGTGRPRRARQTSVVDSGRPFRGPDPVITKITNAIVHKIRTEGSKPTFFVRNSLDDLRAVMVAELHRALARVEKSTGRAAP